MDTKKNKIFLDFDGVIFDSAGEAYAIAMIATQRIHDLFEVDLKTEHAKKFLRQRYLIGPAWNYYYLLQAIDQHMDHNFNQVLPESPSEEAKNFMANFFATRNLIRENQWDKWLGFNRLYEGSESFIQLINTNENICIVTTKDKKTVEALLQNYGVTKKIDIYCNEDYEKFGCKSFLINKIIEDENLERAVFIDDSKKHLEKCQWVNKLTTLHASWGYVSPNDYQDNKKTVLNAIADTLQG